MRRNFCQFLSSLAVILLAFAAGVKAQSDPEGVPDSFYLECASATPETLTVQVRFFSDNTGTNRVSAVGLPLLVSVSNNAFLILDTTVATTFAGSMFSDFPLIVTHTDTIGGEDPAQSPVHFVIGAISLDTGVTGEGIFANLKLALNGDSCTITVDTLSTYNLFPSLVTENAFLYTPGWPSTEGVCAVTDVREVRNKGGLNLPVGFELNQNYPNPFNATTRIAFSLPKSVTARLEIYNVLGRKIATLLDRQLEPGYWSVVWDGKEKSGENAASGLYFYRLKAGKDFTQSKPMLLVR